MNEDTGSRLTLEAEVGEESDIFGTLLALS